MLTYSQSIRCEACIVQCSSHSKSCVPFSGEILQGNFVRAFLRLRHFWLRKKDKNGREVFWRDWGKWGNGRSRGLLLPACLSSPPPSPLSVCACLNVWKRTKEGKKEGYGVGWRGGGGRGRGRRVRPCLEYSKGKGGGKKEREAAAMNCQRRRGTGRGDRRRNRRKRGKRRRKGRDGDGELLSQGCVSFPRSFSPLPCHCHTVHWRQWLLSPPSSSSSSFLGDIRGRLRREGRKEGKEGTTVFLSTSSVPLSLADSFYRPNPSLYPPGRTPLQKKYILFFTLVGWPRNEIE